MSESMYPIMSWNVRGLNQPAKRAAVYEVVTASKVAILCLQETKINVWTPGIVREIGGAALIECIVLPA
uniref:Endonuclease/exonuclease/phosphatase domain-containing protein n=1 Tax=Triticum urartu TaxID=4572 RepID=A0A8R7JVT0_TRIUA